MEASDKDDGWKVNIMDLCLVMVGSCTVISIEYYNELWKLLSFSLKYKE